jgi:hypothetical protein
MVGAALLCMVQAWSSACVDIPLSLRMPYGHLHVSRFFFPVGRMQRLPVAELPFEAHLRLSLVCDYPSEATAESPYRLGEVPMFCEGE